MNDTLEDVMGVPVGGPPGADDEGSVPKAPRALWEPPSGLAGDEPDRTATERLLRTFRNGSPDAAEQSRFHKRPLVRLMLEKSYAAQRLKPESAEELAGQAISLTSAMLRPAEDDPWVLSAAGCAWCLAASAQRSLGRLEGARTALPKAAYFLGLAGGPVERALYLRVAALLRWDQAGRDHCGRRPVPQGGVWDERAEAVGEHAPGDARRAGGRGRAGLG